MKPVTTCPECGTEWRDGVTCQDHFHQMLFWENEYPSYTLDVHHLMVLSYNLQHPSIYSRETHTRSILMLRDFLAGVTPQQMRARMRDEVDSGKRRHTITARPDSFGAYEHPVVWTMTVAHVTSGSIEDYAANVRAWARSIYEALEASDNLPINA